MLYLVTYRVGHLDEGLWHTRREQLCCSVGNGHTYIGQKQECAALLLSNPHVRISYLQRPLRDYHQCRQGMRAYVVVLARAHAHSYSTMNVYCPRVHVQYVCMHGWLVLSHTPNKAYSEYYVPLCVVEDAFVALTPM